MKTSAISLAIDSETGEQFVHGVAVTVAKAPPARPQQQSYTLLQLEVLSGIALKYATRQLHFPSSWAA